jgi:hypothetical protein
MSGDPPDVRRAEPADHGQHLRQPQQNGMPLIEVKVIEGVFTTPQKQEIVERLSDAIVAIEGESMRHATWCIGPRLRLPAFYTGCRPDRWEGGSAAMSEASAPQSRAAYAPARPAQRLAHRLRGCRSCRSV